MSDDAYVPRMLRERSINGMLVAYTPRIPQRMMALPAAFCMPRVRLSVKVAHEQLTATAD